MNWFCRMKKRRSSGSIEIITPEPISCQGVEYWPTYTDMPRGRVGSFLSSVNG